MNALACVRCNSPLEAADVRCPLCCLATVHPLGGAHGGGRVARCDECGAAVAWSVEERAVRCVFCSASTHFEDAGVEVLDPETLLPFLVTPEEAHDGLRRFLSAGFFRPIGLARHAQLESVQAIWWAGWLIGVRAFATWTADTDAGAGRAGKRPHTGQARFEIPNILLSASRGLEWGESERLIEHYDTRTAGPFATASLSSVGPPGARVEPFDTDRSALRTACVNLVRYRAPDVLRRGHLPGTTFPRVLVEPILEGIVTHRLALPAYVLAYRWKERVYRVVVHGQRRQVIIGTAPHSAARLWIAVLGVIGVAVALIVALALAP